MPDRKGDIAFIIRLVDKDDGGIVAVDNPMLQRASPPRIN